MRAPSSIKDWFSRLTADGLRFKVSGFPPSPRLWRTRKLGEASWSAAVSERPAAASADEMMRSVESDAS